MVVSFFVCLCTLTSVWAGLCEVDPTPKGWFIRYIDRSPEALARQAATAKKGKMDKDDEDRSQRIIEQQIARAQATKGSDEEEETPVYTELQRKDEEEKLTFNLFKGTTSAASGSQGAEDTEEGGGEGVRDQPCCSNDSPPSGTDGGVGGEGGFTRKKVPVVNPLVLPNALMSVTAKKKEEGGGGGGRKRRGEEEGRGGGSEAKKKKLTALEEIRVMEEERKERMNRREDWVCEGIVVKVVHKGLGDKYHRRKGEVVAMKDRFTAVVRMLDSGDKIKIDQANLESVIPAIGKSLVYIPNNGLCPEQQFFPYWVWYTGTTGIGNLLYWYDHLSSLGACREAGDGGEWSVQRTEGCARVAGCGQVLCLCQN